MHIQTVWDEAIFQMPFYDDGRKTFSHAAAVLFSYSDMLQQQYKLYKSMKRVNDNLDCCYLVGCSMSETFLYNLAHIVFVL